MEKKLQLISGSLVVIVPKLVCDLYSFQDSDTLAIEPIIIGELRLRKMIFNENY